MPAKTNDQLYEEAERQLISEAIGETEQEIFDSAFDNAPDDNDSDTSLEEMDSDDVIDDDIDEDNEDREPAEGEGEFDDEPEQPKTEQPEERQPQRGIPPGRLREEADARRAAETRERDLRSELDQLKGQLQAVQNSFRQPAPPPQQPPPAPDLFADPEGWQAAFKAQTIQEFNNRRFNDSMADAHEQHGDKFEAAFNALRSMNGQNPADVATAQRIYNAPNPGRELMKWHDQQSLLREIGTDPAAYRQKLREEMLSDPEVRQQLISGMRQDATGNRRTNVQLPPSLNGASGGSGHRSRDGGGRDTAYTTRSMEREIFDSVWDDK